MTDGLAAVPGGIAFVLTNPTVWVYALVPVGVLLVLGCGLSGLGIWSASWLSEQLVGARAEGWTRAGGWLLTGALAAAAILPAMLAAVVLAQPLSGFALEAIACVQERTLTGRSPQSPSLLRSLFESTKIALVTAVVGGAVLGSLFAVSLLFPPAAVVTVPLKFLAGAWLLAWNFVDYPLGLHRLGVRARLRWAAGNLGAFTAFGLTWALLLLVPGIFLLVLPMGVAGATRLVVADGGLQQ